MLKHKRVIWLCLIAVMIAVTVWVISGLDSEMKQVEIIIPDDDLLAMAPSGDLLESGDWGYDQGGAFFVEYRLQRDRVRARELEMLESILNNPNSSMESKEEAEHLMIEIIKLIEEELLVENMIKAYGFDDAIFFYRNRVATVVIRQKELSEREFIQVADAVAGILGIDRENVQVITRF